MTKAERNRRRVAREAQLKVLQRRGVPLPQLRARKPKPDPVQAAPPAAPPRVRARTDPADPAPQTFEPGLGSLAGGVGKNQLSSTGRFNIIPRDSVISWPVYTAVDAAMDWNPDASYGAWVYLLLGLLGMEVVAYNESGEKDDALLAEGLAFSDRIFKAYGGGVAAGLVVAMQSAMRRGAIAVELDIADSLDEVLDVDFVDPRCVDFQVLVDGDHKSTIPVYLPATGGAPVPFNLAQFTYIPILPRLGLPHGVLPFLPLADAAYPYAELRDSLQKVAKSQGFSRIKFSYKLQEVMRAAPPDTVEITPEGAMKVRDWDKMRAHVQQFKEDLQADIEDIFEDDSWVLPDLVETGSVGADHVKESMDFGKLAQLFDQDVITATKGQPAVFGRQWGSDLSSTGAIQWVIQALGIEALREPAAEAVAFGLNRWLVITGRRGYFEIKFPKVRREDRLAEANAAKVETETELLRADAGIIDLDEAAQNLVGHDATGTPRLPTAPPPPPAAGANSRGSDDPAPALPVEERILPTSEVRVDPFTPPDTDAAGPLELDQDPPPGPEDADRISRDFDRWARTEAASFEGIEDSAIVTSRLAPPPTNGHARLSREAGPAPAGRWQFDENLARYRYPARREGRLGQLLPLARLDRLFERRLEVYRRQGREVTDRYLDGKMSTRDWQDALKRVVRDAQLEARMLGVGGRNNMTFADFGAAGGRIGADYRAIGFLGQQVVNGELSPAQIRQAVVRRFEARIRGTFQAGREAVHARAGYHQERNILEAGAEHCGGCLEASQQGWVAIGTVTPIGERDCKNGCKCSLEFRVSEEQAMPDHAERDAAPMVLVGWPFAGARGW